MKIQNLLLTTIFGLILSACNLESSSPSFQLVTTPEGKTLRLNSHTGETHLVTQSGLKRLDDDWVTLQVGEYYQMSDATTDVKFLKYLGAGKFEQTAMAIKMIEE